jgi:hypothetical protein
LSTSEKREWSSSTVSGWQRLRLSKGKWPLKSGATPFQWTVLGLRLSFLFAESFRS